MRKTGFLLGVMLAVVGLMMIVAPAFCIKVAVILLGVESMVNGIYSLVKVRQLISDHDFQVVVLVRGIISIAVGFLAVFLPLRFAESMWTVMLYVLAAYLLVAVALGLCAASKLRARGIDRRQYVLECIISVISAAVLIILPRQMGVLLVRIIGGSVMFLSVVFLFYEWKNRPIVVDNVEVVDDNQAGVDKKNADADK